MDKRAHENKLFTPAPPFRPGDEPDFSFLEIPRPDEIKKPDITVKPESIRDLAYGLVRVLDDDNRATGSWAPGLSADQLRVALENMMLTRAYDDRMLRMQRQGKLSFYIKSTGEEAVSIGQVMALRPEDMLFPTYRQQGLLIARGRNLVDMMCHCISNSRDNLKGRQMPTFYSWKDGNFFSISGNVGTQFSQAVGWAMASAYKGEDAISVASVGEGGSAEADFYYGLLFASSYRAPVIMNVINNQWAISVPQILPAGGTTFAARGTGFNIPSIRADGNDLLAVYSVTAWAVERARSGYGPTLIELFTYRREGHSSSDNPDSYRPKNEAEAWPLGDPIERLKQHLMLLDEWNEQEHEKLTNEIKNKVDTAWKEAESYGTLEEGPRWPVDSLFDDVFKECPQHLHKQRHMSEI